MQIYAIIILYNAFDGGILHRKKKKALNITTHQPILGVRYPDGVTCGGTQHLVNYRLVDMGWANVCTARSRGSQHDAMLSGETLRDGNDRRVFMQNFKSWYLMSRSGRRASVRRHCRWCRICFVRTPERLGLPLGCPQRKGPVPGLHQGRARAWGGGSQGCQTRQRRYNHG